MAEKRPPLGDVDPRAVALPEAARRCRERGTHRVAQDWLDLLKESFGRDKKLIDFREVTLEQPCETCGAVCSVTYDTWARERIKSTINYSAAEGYLMPPGTGWLPRADVRAVMMDDIFGAAGRRRR